MVNLSPRRFEDRPTQSALVTAIALRAAQLTQFDPPVLIQADNENEFVADLVCWRRRSGIVWVWQFLHVSQAEYADEDLWPSAKVMNSVRVDVLSCGLDLEVGPKFQEIGIEAASASCANHWSTLVTVYDGHRAGLQLYRTNYQDRNTEAAAANTRITDKIFQLVEDKNREVWEARRSAACVRGQDQIV